MCATRFKPAPIPRRRTVRIALHSFGVVAFPVIPVTQPAAERDRGGTPVIPVVAELLSRPVSDATRRVLARYAGCGLPDSLEDWLASEGALEIGASGRVGPEPAPVALRPRQPFPPGCSGSPSHLPKLRRPCTGELLVVAEGGETHESNGCG